VNVSSSAKLALSEILAIAARMRSVEQCWLLTAGRDGDLYTSRERCSGRSRHSELHTGIALCRACAHILPAHHNIYQRHLHREIGLCKRFSRCHDCDDAHLRRCSRRWWLCLPSQMDLLNISVQSLQSGTCSAGLWDDNLRHHGHHFGQGVVNLRWVHMPSPVCLWCASEGGTADIW
jgi:hypothetical protein